MIIVAVIGIMGAIIVPQFQLYSIQAKKAVAKDALRLLRSAIELYTAQHSGIPPGYESDDPTTVPTSENFLNQLVARQDYLAKMPKNPFNNLENIKVIGNSDAFPSDALEGYGWIYQAATKTIRLNWSGVDSSGLRYFEY